MTPITRREFLEKKEGFYRVLCEGYLLPQDYWWHRILDNLNPSLRDLLNVTKGDEFQEGMSAVLDKEANGASFKELVTYIGQAERFSDDLRLILVLCLYAIAEADKKVSKEREREEYLKALRQARIESVKTKAKHYWVLYNRDTDEIVMCLEPCTPEQKPIINLEEFGGSSYMLPEGESYIGKNLSVLSQIEGSGDSSVIGWDELGRAISYSGEYIKG